MTKRKRKSKTKISNIEKTSNPSESSDNDIIDVEVVSKDKVNKDSSKTSSALVPGDALTNYLAEIRRYPLLTKEEEYNLAVQFKEHGDRKAAEKLVTSNLRFVVKIAAEYAKFGGKMIDLIQEGNVGLMHAIKEFNPYKGVRLITYAVWWIRGYIREYLMKQHSMVKIGTTHNQKKLFYQLKKEEQKLLSQGIEPDVTTLSENLGVPEKDVASMKERLSGKDVSLDSFVDDESKTTLLDFQSEPDASSPFEELAKGEELELLRIGLQNVRSKLNEKELALLDERVLGDPPKTLQEIGDQFGITRERARQLENRLIKKIKSAIESLQNIDNPE